MFDPARVLLHDLAVEQDGRVLRPLRVVRVLEEDDRDRALDALVLPLARGEHHHVRRARDRVHEDLRLPAEPVHVLVGLDHELRRREQHQDPGLRRAQARDLGLDVVVGRRVADARDDVRLPGAEPALEALDEVAAVAVVLIEDRDLGFRLRSPDVRAVHGPFGDVRRLVGDRPRILLAVAAERRAAGRDEELRHVLRVQVRAGRLVLLGAERVEDREDVLVLDEDARLADGLRRDVLVVEVLVVDLPLVHAAARVDVLEVGVQRPWRPTGTPGREPLSGAVPPMWIEVGVIPGSACVPPKATGIPSTRSAAVAMRRTRGTRTETECIAELLAD